MRRSSTSLLASLLIVAAASGAKATTLGTCGWFGRVDPIIFNAASPDEDAVYYASALPLLPPGFSYRIRGEFPHARYMSFVVYDGVPIDSVGDFEIEPEPGSTNPFLEGADRTVTDRPYTIRVTFNRDEDAPRVLYAGPGQTADDFPVPYQFPAPYMAYRIYVPDDGAGIRGGVDLPRIEIVADGVPDVDASAIPCEGVRDLIPDLTAVHEAIIGLGFPARPPVAIDGKNPITWSTSTGTNPYETLQPLGIGAGTTGGIGSNPHNTYIGTRVSRAFGDVVAIRAKAPTAPKTRGAEPVMDPDHADLRYWSFCSNSGRTTRYYDCISDSDIVVEPDGTFTIAISSLEDKPANATNWIAFGPEPEARLLYRHMLPSTEFHPYSAQNVEESGGNIEDVMGAYYPTAVYCTKATFELNRCGL